MAATTAATTATPSRPAPRPADNPARIMPGETYTEACKRVGYQLHGNGNGQDSRGSAAARRKRAAIMVGRIKAQRGAAKSLTWGGDGTKVPCFYCAAMLTENDLTQDRIDPTGGYNLPNLRAACNGCNKRREVAGNSPNWRP